MGVVALGQEHSFERSRVGGLVISQIDFIIVGGGETVAR